MARSTTTDGGLKMNFAAESDTEVFIYFNFSELFPGSVTEGLEAYFATKYLGSSLIWEEFGWGTI